ncbi:MAG TPA: metallophosphoesterase family protein [Labilithrix sp.]|jgi:predicted phosphodiesterase
MRLGLVGDVHAEDERLRVVLDSLASPAMRVDRILCTGDLVDGDGDVDRACALIAERGVVTARGEHDRWIRDDTRRDVPHAHRMTSLAPASIELLKSLPPTVTLETPRGKLLLCHGVGQSDTRALGPNDGARSISSNDELLNVLFDPTIAIMVGGHTHVSYVRRFERAPGQTPLWIVNPGTLARGDAPGFATLDLAAWRVDFFSLDDSMRVVPKSRAML